MIWSFIREELGKILQLNTLIRARTYLLGCTRPFYSCCGAFISALPSQQWIVPDFDLIGASKLPGMSSRVVIYSFVDLAKSITLFF